MSVSLYHFETHPTGEFNNHAKAYARITALPLCSAMGAEIRGVDLSEVDDEQFEEIRDAFYHHKMIYFRDQKLTLEDQEALTRRFGPYAIDAYTNGIEGHPNLQRVVKEAGSRTPFVFGGSWHTDSPFLKKPPAIGLLYGVDVPPYGGDTWWANTELAYNFLSDVMKQMLKPLRVVMSARKVYDSIQAHAARSGCLALGSTALSVRERQMSELAEHPLVMLHPVTRAPALNVNETYSVGIAGMTDAEAGALISFLCAHITQCLFTCRLRWEPGTFVIWDNLSSQHHAFNDYDGYRREMVRSISEGCEPVREVECQNLPVRASAL